MVRVNARNKFYGSAVTRLQQVSGVFNPTSKLAVLAETFSEITQVGAGPFPQTGPCGVQRGAGRGSLTPFYTWFLLLNVRMYTERVSTTKEWPRNSKHS